MCVCAFGTNKFMENNIFLLWNCFICFHWICIVVELMQFKCDQHNWRTLPRDKYDYDDFFSLVLLLILFIASWKMVIWFYCTSTSNLHKKRVKMSYCCRLPLSPLSIPIAQTSSHRQVSSFFFLFFSCSLPQSATKWNCTEISFSEKVFE